MFKPGDRVRSTSRCGVIARFQNLMGTVAVPDPYQYIELDSAKYTFVLLDVRVGNHKVVIWFPTESLDLLNDKPSLVKYPFISNLFWNF